MEEERKLKEKTCDEISSLRTTRQLKTINGRPKLNE